MSDSLPANWAMTTLGTVCEPPVYGWTTRAAPGRHGVKFLRTTDISRGPIDWNTVPACDDEPDNLDKYALAAGDLVISRAGSVGLSALIEDCPRAVFASYLIRFRHRPGIEPRFLKWYLQSSAYWEQIGDAAAGIALQNVNAKKLAAVRLPIAPLAEQRRIVAALEEHLSDLEAAVAGLERARTRVSRYKQSVIDRATQNGGMVSLSSVLKEPLRNGHSAPKAADGVGVRVFSISAVTEGDFSERNTKIAAMDPTRVESLWAVPGDIFVQRSNTPELVGTARLYDGPERFAVFPDLLIRVRTKPEALPEYVELVMRSTRVRHYYRSVAQGIAGTMPKIDQGAVERTTIPLPSPSQQSEIVDTVSAALAAADRIAAEIEIQLVRARRLRQAILKRAFEGKLVAQDPKDEPASALLARLTDSPSTTTVPRTRGRTRTTAL